MASVPPKSALVRFGTFELDIAASELRNAGRIVRLPPQPFKLLLLFTGQAGQLVTRDDIRKALWDEQTFIDFDQAVNFTVKQLREALKDDADRALYIQTVPKRGYRFIAPVDTGKPAAVHAQGTDGTLTKLTHSAGEPPRLWVRASFLPAATDLIVRSGGASWRSCSQHSNSMRRPLAPMG